MGRPFFSQAVVRLLHVQPPSNITAQPNSNQTLVYLCGVVSPVASTMSASAATYNAMLVQVLVKRLRWAVAGRQPGRWIGRLVRPSFYPEPKQCPAG